MHKTTVLCIYLFYYQQISTLYNELTFINVHILNRLNKTIDFGHQKQRYSYIIWFVGGGIF